MILEHKQQNETQAIGWLQIAALCYIAILMHRACAHQHRACTHQHHAHASTLCTSEPLLEKNHGGNIPPQRSNRRPLGLLFGILRGRFKTALNLTSDPWAVYFGDIEIPGRRISHYYTCLVRVWDKTHSMRCMSRRDVSLYITWSIMYGRQYTALSVLCYNKSSLYVMLL